MAKSLSILLNLLTSGYEQGVKVAGKKTDELIKKQKEASAAVKEGWSGIGSTITGAGVSIDNIAGSSDGAVQGLSNISLAMKVLKAATGPVGIVIGVIATALAALHQAFTSSREGGEAFASVMGILKGVFNIFQNVLKTVGDALLRVFQDPKKAIKDLWEFIKSELVIRFNGMVNLFMNSFEFLENGFAALGNSIKGLWDDDAKKKAGEYWDKAKENIKGVAVAMKDMYAGGLIEKANAALKSGADIIARTKKLEEDRNKFQYREIDTLERIAKLKELVKKENLIAEDTEKTLEERQKSALNTIALTKQMHVLMNGLLQEKLRIQKEDNSLTGESFEDYKAIKEIQKELNLFTAENNDQLTTYNNKLNSINKEYQKLLVASVERPEIVPDIDAIDWDSIADQMVADANVAFANIPKPEPIKIQPLEYDFDSLNNGFSILENFKGKFAQVAQATQKESMNLGASIATIMGESTKSMGASLAQGADSLSDFANKVGESTTSIVGDFISQGVAAVVSSALRDVSLSGPYGFLFATAAAGIAGGAAKSLFMSMVSGNFENGGIIPGSSFKGDNLLIAANSGEMVLNYAQQKNLFDMINQGSTATNVNPNAHKIEIEVFASGSNLRGAMTYDLRKKQAMY